MFFVSTSTYGGGYALLYGLRQLPHRRGSVENKVLAGDDPQAELMARREVDYIRSHSPDLNPEVVEEEKFWGRA